MAPASETTKEEEGDRVVTLGLVTKDLEARVRERKQVDAMGIAREASDGIQRLQGSCDDTLWVTCGPARNH